jgi:heme/copper-type cytochrome/quinol oxidase subunit 3
MHAHMMESANDFMKENDWKIWREHASVAASFAVYFLSLQLYRFKQFGTFLPS